MPEADLDPGTVVARGPEVIGVRVGSVLVLHDPCEDSYVRLNESGEAVWERLSSPCSLAELGATLAAWYRLPGAAALEDARRVVLSLAERGMVALDGP